MISSTLRSRVRALTAILGLDLLGGEPDLRSQTAAAAAADDETHRADAAAPVAVAVAGGVR